MSKNGPTAVRIGFSAADAIASKVPIVPTRTNGQINLAKHLAEHPHLRPLVEAKQAKGWKAARIAEWLKHNGHVGSFRLKAWLDKAKTKPVPTRYSFNRKDLEEDAETAIAKRFYRHARLAEFSAKSKTWKRRVRWPAEKWGKKRK